MKCKVNGCKRDIYVKKHGLCKRHTERFYKTGDIGDAKIREWNSREPYETPKRYDRK